MNSRTILIVDDEENVSNLLYKILSKEGYAALTADNGINALNIIESRQVDIVITDIKMPGMSGIELLKKIKGIDPIIKVIIITAFATLETAIEALKIGANDYITKPFDIGEIITSVKRLEADLEEYSLFTGEFRELNESVERFLSSKSSVMNRSIELIKQVADTRSTVMLHGETGTGKELAAMALHSISSRNDKPFIKVNCAAIPEQLLESELFGYEKGAFTGAVAKKPGKFELANEGTIFLDEIGDISNAMQVKLLRVLQEREFEHLGGTKTIKVDVRVISATNKNIEELVKKGIIREDLYYRLNVVPIVLPPLRDRIEDIPDLIHQFLYRSSQISGKDQKHI
jgi:DNA-binding NtrC family response regulator